MPRVGFEPTISAGERPKTYALDRAATGIDKIIFLADVWVQPIGTSLRMQETGFFTLQDEADSCPETSVRNYRYSLRNNPEERSFRLLRGGSLKSRMGACKFISDLMAPHSWRQFL